LSDTIKILVQQPPSPVRIDILQTPPVKIVINPLQLSQSLRIFVNNPPAVKINISNVPQPISIIRAGVSINNYRADNYSFETAGETISSGKIVYLFNGKVYNFDPSNVILYGRSFGISKTSGLLNSSIQIQWTGKFYESGLGLIGDEIYYAGLNGLPTQNINGFALIQPIGFSINTDTLFINFTTALLTS
jgi:hypothetical protein